MSIYTNIVNLRMDSRGKEKKKSYFFDGFQQAQTVTRVTRTKMPTVDNMI